MANDDSGGGSNLGTGMWSLAIQALNRIAQSLTNLSSGGLPGATQTTAGSASGLYMIVTANGQQYVVQLLNPK